MNPKTLIEAAFNSETNRASPTDGSFFADPFLYGPLWILILVRRSRICLIFTKITKLSFSGWNNLESKWRSKITRLVNWSNFVSQTFENNEFFFGKFFLLILRLF